mmetsp:Transcript_125904/g.367858  ORF Transcript_125904/g.367858 Transcript_125904/m.367858 type:complete len:241 (-) Transcript_125904:818-1540(-)
MLLPSAPFSCSFARALRLSSGCPSAVTSSSCARLSKLPSRLPNRRSTPSFSACKLSSSCLTLKCLSMRNSEEVTLPEKLRSISPKMLTSPSLYPIFLTPSAKVLSVISCLCLKSMASKAACSASRPWPKRSRRKAWKASSWRSAKKAVWRLSDRKSARPMAAILEGLTDENTASMSSCVLSLYQFLSFVALPLSFLSESTCRKPPSKFSKLSLSAAAQLWRNSKACASEPKTASSASDSS